MGLGLGLLLLGLPEKGANPRFLQFYSAPIVFPPIVMILLVVGVAEMITAFYRYGKRTARNSRRSLLDARFIHAIVGVLGAIAR